MALFCRRCRRVSRVSGVTGGRRSVSVDSLPKSPSMRRACACDAGQVPARIFRAIWGRKLIVSMERPQRMLARVRIPRAASRAHQRLTEPMPDVAASQAMRLRGCSGDEDTRESDRNDIRNVETKPTACNQIVSPRPFPSFFLITTVNPRECPQTPILDNFFILDTTCILYS